MAYADAKLEAGKELVIIVEIDVDKCSLTYGSSPCTASGPAAAKCFNTFGTCQDTANYAGTTKTFRFANRIIDGVQATGDAPTFPTVVGIKHAPTVLEPSKGFGIRSTVTVTLTDHPDGDVGTDPYLSDRDYDPNERSTFWGKFLARNLYYEGRVMRVKTGYLDSSGNYDATNFTTRQYIIDKIAGPTPNGKIQLMGKDPLKFADNSRKQFPVASQAVLAADITNSANSFDITDSNDDVKNAYDAGQVWIRVDDEIMEMTNLTGSNPTYTLTVTRGTAPSFYEVASTADSHSEEATVQNCYLYEDEPVDDILYHLLVTVTGINSSFIDTTAWQEKMDDGYQAYEFSTLLTEPVGVQDLIKEILQHTFLLWWNERTQKIEFDTLLPRAPDYGPFTDNSTFISGSTAVTRDVTGRLSRVYLWYGHRNPTLDMDKSNYFAKGEIDIDATLEGSDAYDDSRIMTIWSRWLPLSKRAVASELVTRLLNEYKDTKKVVTFTADPKDDDAWTGDTVKIQTRQVVDDFGQEVEVDYRILQVSEQNQKAGVVYKYVAHSLRDVGRLGVITPDLDPADGVSAFPDYSSATEELKSRYAFISPNSGTFSDGTDAYVIR
jgi:hypothetical protein